MKRSLLLGCGNSREKRVYLDSDGPEWAGELTTIDMNPNCGADIVMDIGHAITGGAGFLPFPYGTFDELGAFDALEHWGQQGDWRWFFREFEEYHRVLKPGGLMYIVVPIGADAFADPGHTRFFTENHFAFLSQDFYQKALEAKQPVTDYRHFWKHDFQILAMTHEGDHHLGVILRKA